MDPETRRFLRQNIHLVHDADLRAEVQDWPEADNLRRPNDASDAARIAQAWCDLAQSDEAREGRRASRVVLILIVASVAAGVVIGHFAVKAIANAAATVVQAEQFQGEW